MSLKNSTWFAGLAFTVAATTLYCSDESSKGGAVPAAEPQLVVSLPDSVANPAPTTTLGGSLSGKLRAASLAIRADAGVGDSVEALREMNGLAVQVGAEVEALLKQIEESVAAGGYRWKEEVVIQINDPVEGDMRILAGPSAVDGYTKHLSLWIVNADIGDPKALEADWAGGFDRGDEPRGTVYMGGPIFGAALSSMIVRFEFDTASSAHGAFMGLTIGAIPGDGPAAMAVWAAKRNSQVTLFGDAYFPSFPDESGLFTGAARNYVYAAAADAAVDIGAFKIAFPAAAGADQSQEEVFTNASLGDVYQGAATFALNLPANATLLGAMDLLDGSDDDAYDALALNTVAGVAAALADEQLDDDTNAAIWRLLFSLENPFYVDRDGYVAHGPEAQVAAEYGAQAAAADEIPDEAYIGPADLKTLNEEWTATAPWASPDMPAEVDVTVGE